MWNQSSLIGSTAAKKLALLATSFFGCGLLPSVAQAQIIYQPNIDNLQEQRDVLAVQSSISNNDCVSQPRPNQERFAIQSLRVPTPSAGPLMMSKSAAILGGKLSKLDQMRLAQAGMPVAGATEIPVSTISPPTIMHHSLANLQIVVTADFVIDNAAHQSTSYAENVGLSASAALDGDEEPATICSKDQGYFDNAMIPQPEHAFLPNTILGSQAIAIGSTPFDASWTRVSKSTPNRQMRRNLAATGANSVTDKYQQVALVNKWVNRQVAFADDRKLYRKADYWATASETLARRAGDCEDFAIAKMELLHILGISRNDMRLVIARDLVRNADHAILVVTLPGGPVLLDNSTDLLLDARLRHDYRPIMSFASNKKFIHGYAAIQQPVVTTSVSIAMLSVPSVLPIVP